MDPDAGVCTGLPAVDSLWRAWGFGVVMMGFGGADRELSTGSGEVIHRRGRENGPANAESRSGSREGLADVYDIPPEVRVDGELARDTLVCV